MSDQDRAVMKKVDAGYEIIRDRLHVMVYLIMGGRPEKATKEMVELRKITIQLFQLTNRGKWAEALAILDTLNQELPTWEKADKQCQLLIEYENDGRRR